MAVEGDEGGLSPARVETLCDGVFAIAMTILVLELHAPEPAPGLDRGRRWRATR